MNRRLFLKKSGLFIPTLFFLRKSIAQSISINGGTMQIGLTPGGGGGGSCTPTTLVQDFETGALPSGWSVIQGAPTWNYTPQLLGNFSLGMADNATGVQVHATGLGNKAELFGFFFFKTTTMPAGSTNLLLLRDSSTNFHLLIGIDGATSKWRLQDGTNSTNLSTTISAATLYYVWFHYLAGNGANSVAEMWYDTTLTRPPSSGGKYATLSGGTNTASIDQLELRGSQSDANTPTAIVDHIGLDTTCKMLNGF